MSEPSRDLLRRLTLAAGAPGSEDEVRAIVREELEGAGTLTHDRLGSVLCEREGSSARPRVVLDAHLDEVGFMVQSITKNGHVRFLGLGGWWGHVLPAQRVDILTADGKVPGVIGSKPPHFLTAAEREKVQKLEELYIDVGASSKKGVEALGIRLGDSVVPHCEWMEMAAPDILSSKAFDDRAGVGVLCETMKRLAASDHPNTVIGIGAVQEEVGCRGAETASELSEPDVAIILEGTPADDLGGNEVPQAVLGDGPQVRLYDPTAIHSRRLVRLIERVAREREIPMQLAVRRTGGTDARAIHVFRAGVPTVVIGVPARYIHTHVGLIHWRDYAAMVDLATATVQALDEAAVASLTEFD